MQQPRRAPVVLRQGIWRRTDARFALASGRQASAGRVGQRGICCPIGGGPMTVLSGGAAASQLVRPPAADAHRAAARSAWGWEQLWPWLNGAELPGGPLLCVIDGPTRGRPCSGAAVRGEFRRLAAEAGVRRRFAPHQLRHAHALELAREGIALNIIHRQLGHTPTSAQPRSTCKDPRRSSRPCARAARRCRPAGLRL
jgi:hypothetical protein